MERAVSACSVLWIFGILERAFWSSMAAIFGQARGRMAKELKVAASCSTEAGNRHN